MKKKKKLPNSFLKRLLITLGSIFTVLVVVFLISKPTECANAISCTNDLSGEYQSDQLSGEFMGQQVKVPDLLAEEPTPSSQAVLSGATPTNKKIEVDLTTQKIYAYENGSLMYQFPISSGKWNYTPTGDFKIWIKLRYTRMTGGNKAIGTFYDLPNVPYTMFFYNDKYPKSLGYGIHGAYWHNNFGHPMSHGCINMKTEDVAKLYTWANPSTTGNTTYATDNNPGTPLTIYGTTPRE